MVAPNLLFSSKIRCACHLQEPPATYILKTLIQDLQIQEKTNGMCYL